MHPLTQIPGLVITTDADGAIHVRHVTKYPDNELLFKSDVWEDFCNAVDNDQAFIAANVESALAREASREQEPPPTDKTKKILELMEACDMKQIRVELENTSAVEVLEALAMFFNKASGR